MKLRPAGTLLLLFIAANLLFFGWRLWRGRPGGELRVTFLDVGQGDAAVIETPGGRVLVVDTGDLFDDGSDDQGRCVVAPFLRSRGHDSIDALLLSHPHADHIGGAVSLLRGLRVGLLLDNGAPTGSPLVAQILAEAKRRGVLYRAARRGQEMDFGDGVTAQVLAPTDAMARGPINDASITLRVSYGRTAFLFTGDAEEVEETELIRSGQPLACDVLKVAHHGSRTSTTEGFLSAARPRIAVISVGANNLYGHPSTAVLNRLKASGASVFRTDRHGAVTCLSDGVTVRVETMQAR